MKNFTLYYDPSHGWLEVPLADLRAAGLKPGDFSAYSYRDSNSLYLEEDRDARKFLQAWRIKIGGDITINEHELRNANFIRRLPRNSATHGVY